MGHVEDRWWNTVIRNDKKVRVKTDRYGKGNRYRVRYTDPGGRERSKSFPNNEKDAAETFLDEMSVDIRQGEYIDPDAGKIRFQDYAAAWLSGLTINVSTIVNIDRHLRQRILPYFGKMYLSGIKPLHVKQWVKQLDGKAERSTQAVAFGHLSQIFSAAIDDEFIRKNPCAAKTVSAPTADARKVVPWTFERVRLVQSKLASRYHDVALLGAGCGLRMGEIFGLSPEDVSEDLAEIHIRRQIKAVNGRLVFAPPKGDKDRFVPLPRNVHTALTQRQADPKLAARKITLPWKVPNGDLVTVEVYFTGAHGKAMRPSAFMGNHWSVAVEAAGIIRDRSTGLHALRHHYASVLLDAGESIKAVSEYLGHHDPAFTLRTYTHLMPSSKDRTREAVEAVWA